MEMAVNNVKKGSPSQFTFSIEILIKMVQKMTSLLNMLKGQVVELIGK